MTPKSPIAMDWFTISAPDEYGVRQIEVAHTHDYGGGDMWLIEGTERCLLVETGAGIAPLRRFLETATTKPIIAFASVGYYDHAGGLHQFDERLIHKADAHRVSQPTRHNTVAEYYMGTEPGVKPYDTFDPNRYVMPASEPTRLLADGDTIDLGDRIFEVLHLPGITAGASALFERESGILFTGEAFVWSDRYLYDGEPAERSDDADQVAFRNSLNRLIDLPATAVYRGHYGRSSAAEMKAVAADYLAGREFSA
ncbi:MAG: MBL fold metallo-hydrolase [Pikeienuella sp.]